MGLNNMAGSSRRNFLAIAGSSTVASLAGCVGGNGNGNGLPTIRYVGISGAALNDLMTMFHASDYVPENVMEHVGEEYQFEFIDVQSTAVTVNTLGADEADAGLLAYSSYANMVQEDVIPEGVAITAPLTYDGVRYADTYCTQPGSDITEPSDLEGNALGINGVGSAIDIAARYVFIENDVDLDDIEFREVEFGAMHTTLAEGGVDAGTYIQPFYAMEEDDLEIVFDTTDAFGSFLKIFIGIRNDFLEDNQELVEYMFEDFWQGIEWWRDDENSDTRLEIAEQVTGLPGDVLEGIVQTDQGYYHGEDGLRIDPETLQVAVDGMYEVGQLDEQIDVGQYVDNSYLPDDANVEPDLD